MWHSRCSRSRRLPMNSADKTRAIKILARSIYKDLEGQGFDEKQIVALATELISEVTTRMSTTSRDAQALRRA
jgi:hypothetical protein